ncbi:MAG: tRNA pseudouridine(54/55) synthase Pus10 [Candidatus Odinarchaeia archaeon]
MSQEEKIQETALTLLKKYTLCDNCLGRQFALLSTGLENRERGRCIKTYLTLIGSYLTETDYEKGIDILKTLAEKGEFQPAQLTLKRLGADFKENEEKCYLCGNLFKKLEDIAQDIVRKLEDYEFDTLLVGCKISPETIEKEDQLRSLFGIPWGESIKAEINREIGKLILKYVDNNKSVDFTFPDLIIQVDLINYNHEIKVNPIFIYGRYRKLIRGIPQTRWPCRECKGKGCARCNYTGKMYETSVEEVIVEPVLKITKGTEAKFHGAGREDIDAVMLGSGRPFVLEVRGVKKRHISLEELENLINKHGKGKIEVIKLSWANRDVLRKIKALSGITKKTYKVIVELEEKVPDEALENAKKVLEETVIKQRTPTRVAHRRADKERLKKIYSFNYKKLNDKKLEITIQCQGGLYVKELINGDGGRTQPNFSDLIGVKATCLELDVIDVDFSEELLSIKRPQKVS